MFLAGRFRAEKVVGSMSDKTPFFKAFGPLLFGRPARKLLGKVGKFDSLQELYEIFGELLPDWVLAPNETGPHSRERLFSKQFTFWAFVAQVLSPGTSCREIVRRVEAWWQEHVGTGTPPSSSTSAYCQARRRLDPASLEFVRGQIAHGLEKNVLADERPLAGRAVKIVDGTGLSMPDTPENQARWPQSSAQAPGCGFPMLKLVGLFSLSSGAWLASASGSQHEHETTLFRSLWPTLHEGDILLADRGFCSYATLAGLHARGVDGVMRLHQMRKADFRT